MEWMAVESVDELKRLGSFKNVYQQVKNDVGELVNVKARGWKGLYEKIIVLQELNEQFNEVLNKKKTDVKPQKTNFIEGYFASEEQEYMYYLLELSGGQRIEKLGISPSHFANKKRAKEWRDAICKKIHPDISKHIKAAEAMSQLNELYNEMIGR